MESVPATLRWAHVLKEAGLSPLESQKLRIKLEIDCNPPEEAQIERVTRAAPYLLALTTYDLPSLMAGKGHAILAWPYTKGRDWYDLLWYCGNQIEPNIRLLRKCACPGPVRMVSGRCAMASEPAIEGRKNRLAARARGCETVSGAPGGS